MLLFPNQISINNNKNLKIRKLKLRQCVKMKIVIYNITQDKLIKQNIKFADSYLKRLKGLMFKKNIDYGIILKVNNPKTKIKSSIHSFFMLITIKVYFVDEKKEIFEIARLKPWKSYTPKKKASYIIEFKEGQIKNNELKIGDKIDFVCEIN